MLTPLIVRDIHNQQVREMERALLDSEPGRLPIDLRCAIGLDEG